MADTITGSTKCLELDNSLNHWEFYYDVEHNGQHNSLCVVVQPEEMVDPMDANEAKTKANVKAKISKDAWIAAMVDATSDVPVITTPEAVTL